MPSFFSENKTTKISIIITIISIIATIVAIIISFIQTSNISTSKYNIKQETNNENSHNIMIINENEDERQINSRYIQDLEKEKEELSAKLHKSEQNNTILQSDVARFTDIDKKLQDAIKQKNEFESLNYAFRQQLEDTLGSNSRDDFQDNKEIYNDLQIAEKSIENKDYLIREIYDKNDTEYLIKLANILIDETESMNKDEKQYWKEIWDELTFEHQVRLLDILLTERVKLLALNTKYLKEFREIFKNKKIDAYNNEKLKAEKTNDRKLLELLKIKENIVFSDVPASIVILKTAEAEAKNFIIKYPDYVNGYLWYEEVLNSFPENRAFDIYTLFKENAHRFKGSPEFIKVLAITSSKIPNNARNSTAYLKEALMLIEDDYELDIIFYSMMKKANDYSLSKEDLIFLRLIFERSLDKKINYSSFVSSYISILFKLEQYKSIFEIINKYHSIFQENQEILFYLALAFYQTENYKEAHENFLKSANPAAFFMAGLAIYENNQHIDEAKKLFVKALEGDISMLTQEALGSIHLALSLSYLKLGDNEKSAFHSAKGVKATYGCSNELLMRCGWHKDMLELLNENRYIITCP